MLRLIRPALESAIDLALEGLQRRFVATGSPAWDAFRQGRVAQEGRVFDAVWSVLLSMSRDRCAFCETKGPSTVEHLVPKADRSQPAKVYDWSNLLPACWECNSRRQASGIRTIPLDPSTVEPLNVLGWDELGAFVAHPDHGQLVEHTVAAYGLFRFDAERALLVKDVQFLLALIYRQSPVRQTTEQQLKAILSGDRSYLGAVREYLLRPPTHVDEMLLDAAIEKMPAIRDWVAPWLNPPAWAASRWP